MLPAWFAILRALDTEPRGVYRIRGASGFPHDILAAGVDLARRRLVIISPEADPRVSAMVQADIQAADNSIHVLTARPVIHDSREFGRFIVGATGRTEVTREEIWEAMYAEGSSFIRRAELFGEFYGDEPGKLPPAHMVQSMMNQALVNDPPKEPPFVAERKENPTISELANSAMDMSGFDSVDIFKADREAGICALPLVELHDSEVEVLSRGSDVDAVEDLLRRLDVIQYFFPAPDQFLLGLAERTRLSRSEAHEALPKVPALGHPYSNPELIPTPTTLPDLIEALEERKLIVEGEISLEITPAGQAVRSTIRFKPRESLIDKVMSRFNVNLDLKDLFKP